MALINLSLPLLSLARIVSAIERIADYCDRVHPPPFAKDDPRAKPPEPGAFVVTDDVIVEEQVREGLRLRGFKPDDIDQMIEDAKSEAVNLPDLT